VAVTVTVAVAVAVVVLVTDSVAVDVAVTVEAAAAEDEPSAGGVDESSLLPTITAAAVPPMTSPTMSPARAATHP
jgi:hypothetical protein